MRRGKMFAFGGGPVTFVFGGGPLTFTLGGAPAAFACGGSPGGAAKEAPEWVVPAVNIICERTGEREI